MKLRNILLVLGLLAPLYTNVAIAADPDAVEAHLVLLNHTFDPQQLTVPAGKKIKLIITNKDASAAEFESSDFNREKVVGANAEIYVYIGPLDPGTYGFFDDFHRDTTTGTIVAK